jgi:hypothetical protein
VSIAILDQVIHILHFLHCHVMLVTVKTLELAWTAGSMLSSGGRIPINAQMTVLVHFQSRPIKGADFAWRRLNLRVSMEMAMTEVSYSLFVGGFQVELNEVILQVYFELVLNELAVLLSLLLLQGQLKVDLHHFLDGSYWDGHQGLVAAGDGIASALEVLEALLSDLDPSVDEGWVVASLVFHKLSLEEYFIIGICEVY